MKAVPRASVLLAIVLTTVAAAYVDAARGGFVWDDRVLISEDPAVQTLRPLPSYLSSAFWHGQVAGGLRRYYRPLVTLSYAIEHRVHGDNPAAFHLINLLLHLLNCALVFALVLRGGGNGVSAALASAAFGLAPRLTESVTWISGRTDLLAALFALAALWTWNPDTRRGRWAPAGLVFLGLLSKEVAGAAFVALAIERFAAVRRGATSWQAALRALLPSTIALTAYAGLRALALRGPPVPTHLPDLPRRVAMVLQALGHYAWMILDPLQPRLLIGLPGVLEPAFLTLGAVALPALVLLIGVVWRRASLSALGLAALAVAALVPVLQIVPLPLHVLAADRFLYLPVAAAVAALACGAAAWGRRVRIAAGSATAVLLILFAITTYLRNQDWSSEIRLWSEERLHSGANPTPQLQLGHALVRAARFEQALAWYRDGLRAMAEGGYANPELEVSLEHNIANCLSELGRTDAALAVMGTLIEREPNQPLHFHRRGLVELRAQDWDDAERDFEREAQLAPSGEAARAALALTRSARTEWRALEGASAPEAEAKRAELLSQIGRAEDAERAWSKVLEDSAAGLGLRRDAAVYLLTHGELSEAEQALARYRQADPDGARALEDVLKERQSEEEELARLVP